MMQFKLGFVIIITVIIAIACYKKLNVVNSNFSLNKVAAKKRKELLQGLPDDTNTGNEPNSMQRVVSPSGQC